MPVMDTQGCLLCHSSDLRSLLCVWAPAKTLSQPWSSLMGSWCAWRCLGSCGFGRYPQRELSAGCPMLHREWVTMPMFLLG